MTHTNDLRALAAIITERTRQDAKWGPQDHPDGTGPEPRVAYLLGKSGATNAEARDRAIARTNTAATGGYVTYEGILTEEWAEAIAAEGDELVTELAQVAAVCVGWLGAIERRTPRKPRCYIAGPIRGLPEDEYRAAFAAGAQTVRRLGYEAVNPLHIAPHDHDGPCPPGYDPGEGNSTGHTSSACFLRPDLLMLLTCDAILLLPGASLEVQVAEACGMTVLDENGEAL